MRNQTSFRLTTTLLPSDTTAKTTQVINKLDQGGNKFYPTFTEETVVLTNDDRTVMETTRATCNDGVLTFVKRGLSDDVTGTPRDNRKLTWNPGTLAFITAGASDWIDKDDDITWTGDQTYTGDFTSTGSATYRGRLITEKGVEYPHFENIEELEAYSSPFGGMFAVVDSDGELYRYNAVSEAWDIVTTSTPAIPAKATTSTIGTVRGATDAEFAAGTATGSSGELLIATPAQIQGVTPAMNLHYTAVNIEKEGIGPGTSATSTWTVPHDGIIDVYYTQIYRPSGGGSSSMNRNTYVVASGTSDPKQINGMRMTDMSGGGLTMIGYTLIYAVKAGTFSVKLTNNDSAENARMDIGGFFYFA